MCDLAGLAGGESVYIKPYTVLYSCSVAPAKAKVN